MTNASRRDFLRGRFVREPERPNAPAVSRDDIDVAARPLPRVIAWLNDPPDPPAPTERHAAFPLLRPPGAIREDQFMSVCTRCEACIEACPEDALRPASARFRAAAGTPIIDPAQAPCRLCEGWPCIEACPEGALVLEGAGAMGTARIQTHDCLNALGTTCSVCVERCPVPSALALVDGRAVVNEAMCTGCGICHHACPAPHNAILILPARNRPARAVKPEVDHG